MFFILFAVLAAKNLKWAIYLLIFALPSYQIRFNLGFLPCTVLEGMIAAVFIVWMIRGRREDIRDIKDIKYLISFIALFLVAATIAIFTGPELQAAAGIWKAYFLEPILFLIVIISTLKKEDMKNVFMVFALSALIMSILAIYQKITGNLIDNLFWADEATRRVTGVFNYPNALALYLAPAVVMLAGYFVKRFTCLAERKSRRANILYNFFFSLTVIAGFLAIYFTKSKGALAGILAGLVFYALFYKNYRKYFLVALIAAVAFVSFLISSGRLDLKGAASVEGGDSISTRIEMWNEAWQMLREKPLLGAGLSGYQKAVAHYHSKKYIEIYLYPHNIFLNFWSEVGLLGLLGFLGVIGYFYYVGFKEKLLAGRCQPSVVLMAGMTTLLVHGLVDVPYFKNDLSILFWILVGMMMVLNIRGKEVNKI